MAKYTKEELFKLIGQLAGSSIGANVTVSYNAARMYNGFGESEGYNENDWGYSVSTKLSGYDITVNAQDKDFEEALWKLAQEIPKEMESKLDWRKKDLAKAKSKLEEFLAKDKPPMPKTNSPYRD